MRLDSLTVVIPEEEDFVVSLESFASFAGGAGSKRHEY
jgi:hypothetical protein